MDHIMVIVNTEKIMMKRTSSCLYVRGYTQDMLLLISGLVNVIGKNVGRRNWYLIRSCSESL